jgi:hypothetical protein
MERLWVLRMAGEAFINTLAGVKQAALALPPCGHAQIGMNGIAIGGDGTLKCLTRAVKASEPEIFLADEHEQVHVLRAGFRRALQGLVRAVEVQFTPFGHGTFEPELRNAGKSFEQIVISRECGRIASAHEVLLGLLPARDFPRLSLQFDKIVVQLVFRASTADVATRLTAIRTR